MRGYADRLEILAAHRIALWDVIASAHRQGSLDSAIREARPNRLRELVASLPCLRAVAFNGVVAARIGPRLLGPTALTLLPLPSSSPAFAAMPLAEKQQLWLALRKFLD